MHFYEEFLPNQAEYMKLAPMGPIQLHPSFTYEAHLFDFLGAFNGGIDYRDLKLEVPEHMPIENMASNPVTITLLQFLIQTHRPELILEIGTYIGISAIKMAQAMPHGIVNTIEKGEEFHKIAQRNINANATDSAIFIHRGDGLSIVRDWATRTRVHDDLIFLDADKEHYNEYLTPLWTLLKPGGLLVVDDVLFHGDVLNREPTTEKGKGCKRLLEMVKKLSWPKVLLPLANGILLLQKPREN